MRHAVHATRLDEPVSLVERDCRAICRDDHQHIRRTGRQASVKLFEQLRADSLPLQLRRDVDPVQLLVAVMKEPDDRAFALCDEEDVPLDRVSQLCKRV